MSGLEAPRDLAAVGHIEAVHIYSPDRLSRKYAPQVLLAEDFIINERSEKPINEVTANTPRTIHPLNHDPFALAGARCRTPRTTKTPACSNRLAKAWSIVAQLLA
jgi:hypothetical protein